MQALSRTMFLGLLLVPQAANQASGDDRAPGHPAPTVRFSGDEHRVTIESQAGRWTLVRPVVSPWNFQSKGKTYWVANSGDDSGEGTASRPLRTITRALDLAGAGDVVYLREGLYVEAPLIRKSGREDAPIIVSCAPDALGKVKVTPPKDYVQKNPSGAVFTFNDRDCGYDNGGGKLGDPARNTDDHNCYYPGKPEPRIQPGPHEILADPRFLDAKAGDYRIRDDSPCTGKAVKAKDRPVESAKNVGAFQ